MAHANDHDRVRENTRDDSRASRKAPDGSRCDRRISSRDRRRRSESPARHRRHHHRHDEPRRGEGRASDRDRDRDRDRDSRSLGTTRHSSSRSDRHSGHRPRTEDADDSGRNGPRPRRQSPVRRGGPLPSQEASFAVTNGEEPDKPKEKPNFKTSGILAAASNSVAQADGSTVVLKYHEPSEARKPPARDQWKLFIFKGDDIVDTIDLGLRSCWLVGRETAVVDLPAEHPSISKQHAVIQFRYTEKRNEYGDKIGRVKPYLIDLESANGTILNHDKIPDSRYLELRDKDMVQFGHSTREYVVMLAPRE
ncbi:hypothetical protein E4U43_003878 [Claviceps pusilla]|uniref:FHA domain-containing protein n=1 Tax=Claviceps pusilla TaxID=123648 RepID=A0A9P7SV31_9HYPO|nr:hypothetical protein E4U43_003878 [Claviceps pusilla]